MSLSGSQTATDQEVAKLERRCHVGFIYLPWCHHGVKPDLSFHRIAEGRTSSDRILALRLKWPREETGEWKTCGQMDRQLAGRETNRAVIKMTEEWCYQLLLSDCSSVHTTAVHHGATVSFDKPRVVCHTLWICIFSFWEGRDDHIWSTCLSNRNYSKIMIHQEESQSRSHTDPDTHIIRMLKFKSFELINKC